MKRCVKDIKFLQTFIYEGEMWYRGIEDDKFVNCNSVAEDEMGFAKKHITLPKDTKVEVNYF